MAGHRAAFLIITLFLTGAALAQDAGELAAQADEALRRAVAFFREQVSTHGGYVWRYDADLGRREGEGQATASMAWVQPPGTPSVGMAFLDIYTRLGDQYYLDAATETAHALAAGQLQSGGWDYHIEFDPEKRREYAYRKDASVKGRNVTTLDDNTTQAALGLLIRVDRALEFKDSAIHEAARFGLDALCKAQYPNGAWPQRYSAFPDPKQFPVKPATYPESWPRTCPKQDYTGYYTLNDNTLADTIEIMFFGAEVYGEERYRDTGRRGGEFILLAQMPEPQPAWAQQYNAEMHPAWARKFEPPAITGGESQGVLRILLDLHARTGDSRYLQSAERALGYLNNSRLPGGRLARFYELKTNTPLYFTKTYELTYSNADMPTHYSFITESHLEDIEKALRATRVGKQPAASHHKETGDPQNIAATVKKTIDAMDIRGAWLVKGLLRSYEKDQPTHDIIDTATFIHNVGVLARFAASARNPSPR